MGKPGLVDVSQDYAGEGVVGQNVINQLMKKEQEITDRLLKLGKVENTSKIRMEKSKRPTALERKRWTGQRRSF